MKLTLNNITYEWTADEILWMIDELRQKPTPKYLKPKDKVEFYTWDITQETKWQN